MQETDSGLAKLKDMQSGAEADVEFSISFTMTLRQVRRGFPPVPQHSAEVEYIRTLDGAPVKPGIYLLERASEINRVQLLDAHWYVLS